MSKNLVICCDGTGNQFSASDTHSNVVKLCRVLVQDDLEQWVYYHPGVGTMGSPLARNGLEKQWSRALGLAFGAGLLANAGDAYRYLMEAYADGDRIFLFGFSRGAYTARVLAAMLYMYGLMHRGNEGQIPYLTRMFTGDSRKARRSREEFQVAEAFKQTFARSVTIHFCGLWDTVSSIGWIYDPVKFPFTARNPILRYGRHAISIDERRCFFRDNLWGAAEDGQNLQQAWFAGVHSDIGGSYPELQSGLSKIALEWMVEEAVTKGLLVDAGRWACELGEGPACKRRHARPCATARLHNSLSWKWWPLELLPHRYYEWRSRRQRWRIPLGAPRSIPAGAAIHASVLRREAAADCQYSPRLPEAYTVVPDGKPAPPRPQAGPRRKFSGAALVAAWRQALAGPGVLLYLALLGWLAFAFIERLLRLRFRPLKHIFSWPQLLRLETWSRGAGFQIQRGLSSLPLLLGLLALMLARFLLFWLATQTPGRAEARARGAGH